MESCSSVTDISTALVCSSFNYAFLSSLSFMFSENSGAVDLGLRSMRAPEHRLPTPFLYYLVLIPYISDPHRYISGKGNNT